MIILVIYVLGCYGISTIITQSKITKNFRLFFKDRVPFIHTLLNCVMCTSFWVGLFGSLFFKLSMANLIYPHADMNIIRFVLNLIFDGSFISGIVWLIYLIQMNLEKHVNV